jgi:hypothetical protein
MPCSAEEACQKLGKMNPLLKATMLNVMDGKVLVRCRVEHMTKSLSAEFAESSKIDFVTVPT